VSTNSPTESARPASRFPPWLRKRIPAGGEAAAVSGMLSELGLATVCSGAHCPNLPECYARGTATFLVLGRACTRACRFCAIGHDPPEAVRADEPDAVAEACVRLRLRHVVITSVTRDDLPDGGAGHFAATVRAVRGRLPQAVIEVLTPDFEGRTADVDAVLAAGPDIFNHNVETVPRLYSAVRPQADYRRSLAVLAHAHAQANVAVPATAERGGEAIAAIPRAGSPYPARDCALHTKSGIMVGLGETAEEVSAVLRDLRDAGCDILTIGQYLAPSAAHLPVVRFVDPAEFAAWEAEARALGFVAVASGPFVRSSYHAEDVFRERTRGASDESLSF
jgi:lipoic acid synthetase